MLRRENLIACRSRRNRRRRRTTAGIGWSRPTPLIVRSRLYSITSILPRNRSVMARVHGSTRNGCQSLSRNRTIVMVHLLSRLVFLMEPHDRLERSSPGYGPGTSPSTLAGQGTAFVPPDERRLADVRHAVCRRVLHPPPSRHLVVDPSCQAYQTGARDQLDGGARSRLDQFQLQGSESNRPGSRLMRPGRAQPSLHDRIAGGRGIEPRWPVLETSLIPDRDPGGPVS